MRIEMLVCDACRSEVTEAMLIYGKAIAARDESWHFHTACYPDPDQPDIETLDQLRERRAATEPAETGEQQ
ncbi:hypothetical protein [Nocardia asiatica]|uniref:hypothetical protein n=1 Tax=Nocardia asiatica TaxID=209252 RepID=UPI00245508AD|nr:hypothetical protein [Nocardia asiatica]